MTRYGDLEKKYLMEAIDSDNLFYVKGEKTDALCKKVTEYFGMSYAATMSSGTAAIHCAVGALEIPPGYEIITSPITDMGSLIGPLYQNLVPIFADVDAETYNITPETIEKVITDKTRAILVVHLAANPADMLGIMDLAKKHNLFVIEDCAQAYGAKIGDKFVGTFGDIGCYSLNAYKHISAGDGGFIITDNEDLYEKIHNFADKSYDRHGKGNRLSILAPNYRITELQSAVALAQFEKLDDITNIRNQMGSRFNEGLKDLPGIIPHKTLAGNRCTYWFTMIQAVPPEGVDGKEFRVGMVGALSFEGVPASEGYIPRAIYLERVFQEKNFFPGGIWPAEIIAGKEYSYPKGLCPVAESVLEKVIRISIDETMTVEKIDAMIEGIKNGYDGMLEEFED